MPRQWKETAVNTAELQNHVSEGLQFGADPCSQGQPSAEPVGTSSQRAEPLTALRASDHGSLWLGDWKDSGLTPSHRWQISLLPPLTSVGTGSGQGSSQTSAALSSALSPSLCMPVSRGECLCARLCGAERHTCTFMKIHCGAILREGPFL